MKNRAVILIIGNIGSGKTTLAQKLYTKDFIIIDQDSIREMFGCGKYHYSDETEPIIKKISLELIAELSASSIDFAIDGCLVSRQLRAPIIDIIREESRKNDIHTGITAHVMPMLSKVEALKRRMVNPRGISKEVWSSVWDKFNEKWEHPIQSEGFDAIVTE